MFSSLIIGRGTPVMRDIVVQNDASQVREGNDPFAFFPELQRRASLWSVIGVALRSHSHRGPSYVQPQYAYLCATVIARARDRSWHTRRFQAIRVLLKHAPHRVLCLVSLPLPSVMALLSYRTVLALLPRYSHRTLGIPVVYSVGYGGTLY